MSLRGAFYATTLAHARSAGEQSFGPKAIASLRSQ
jgi:hypothetical protein